MLGLAIDDNGKAKPFLVKRNNPLETAS